MTQTTLFVKDDLLTTLSIRPATIVPFIVGKCDPRQAPFAKDFDTRQAALAAYREAIATSQQRGWEIAYQGPPLQG